MHPPRLTFGLAAALFAAADLPAQEPAASAAFERLVDGNRRFAEGASLRPTAAVADRVDAPPLAVVVTTPDERIVPDFVFDAAPGELVVARTPGPDCTAPATVATVEHALARGTAACIVLLGDDGTRSIDELEVAARERLATLYAACPTLATAVADGRVVAAPGRYAMTTGRVEWTDPPPLTLPPTDAGPDAAMALPPHVALRVLLAGLARHRAGHGPTADLSPTERRALLDAATQPLAVVVADSDTLAPAVLFDTGLGDLHTVRNHGCVASEQALAGVARGALRRGASLIVVLADPEPAVAFATALRDQREDVRTREADGLVAVLAATHDPVSGAITWHDELPLGPGFTRRTTAVLPSATDAESTPAADGDTAAAAHDAAPPPVQTLDDDIWKALETELPDLANAASPAPQTTGTYEAAAAAALAAATRNAKAATPPASARAKPPARRAKSSGGFDGELLTILLAALLVSILGVALVATRQRLAVLERRLAGQADARDRTPSPTPRPATTAEPAAPPAEPLPPPTAEQLGFDAPPAPAAEVEPVATTTFAADDSAFAFAESGAFEDPNPELDDEPARSNRPARPDPAAGVWDFSS